MNKLLVKGGALIDPAQGYFRTKLDVLLDDGLIREIGPDLPAEDAPDEAPAESQGFFARLWDKLTALFS